MLFGRRQQAAVTLDDSGPEESSDSDEAYSNSPFTCDFEPVIERQMRRDHRLFHKGRYLEGESSDDDGTVISFAEQHRTRPGPHANTLRGAFLLWAALLVKLVSAADGKRGSE